MITVCSSIGTIHLSESLTKTNYQFVQTACHVLDGVLGIYVVLYFMFISKDFFWLLLSQLIMQALGMFLFLFLTYEAPRYLLKSGQIS